MAAAARVVAPGHGDRAHGEGGHGDLGRPGQHTEDEALRSVDLLARPGKVVRGAVIEDTGELFVADG